MDYFSTANSQTIPDESVTCIAVKEDLGKRERGKIHRLVGVQRDHVEKRHRASHNLVQKSCS